MMNNCVCMCPSVLVVSELFYYEVKYPSQHFINEPHRKVKVKVTLPPSLKRELTCSIVVIWVNFFQTELMSEIYSS